MLTSLVTQIIYFPWEHGTCIIIYVTKDVATFSPIVAVLDKENSLWYGSRGYDASRCSLAQVVTNMHAVVPAHK